MKSLAPLVLAALLAGCAVPGVTLSPASDSLAPALACVGPCKALVDASPGGGWEPHVAVSPLDPDHVVVATRAQDSGSLPASYSLWFDVHVSRDGGRSWNVTALRATQPFLGGADPNAPNVVGDPVLAFLPDGALLLAGATLQAFGAPGGVVLRNVELFVARSDDGGASFGEPVVVARSEGVLVGAGVPVPLPVQGFEGGVLLDFPDKPWVATGPDGTALLTWTRYRSGQPDAPAGWAGDLLLSASTDGGRSWGDPIRVASGPWTTGSAPAVGLDGAWHVAYADLEAREARVATSRDRGATWTDASVAPAAWMPAFAVSRGPTGDRLYLASATPEGDGVGDAVLQTPTLSWSDDGGASWTPPLALDAPEAPGRVLPSVAVDAEGVAFVTFAHALGEDASAFRAVALRPGAWRADLALDEAIAGPTRMMGDYLGLAAGARGAFAVWSTTEDGREYDVAGAALRLPHDSNGGG